MGRPAHAMVDMANSAVDVAGDDLPLEIAIITGAYDAANHGKEAGFTKDGIYDVAVAAGRSACRAVERAKRAGMTPVKLIATANSVNGTTLRSIEKMTDAGLSSGEIAHVVDTIGTVYQENIDLAATTGATSNVEAALKYSEDHVDKVVASEMSKSSDGDTTSDALLANAGSNATSPVASADPWQDDTAAPVTGDRGGNNGNAANNTNAPVSNSAGTNTRSSDYAPTTDSTKPGYAVATDAATQEELRNAHDAIVVTDPATGVVALNDGTLFDPAYYAAANPDVAASFGTSTEALLAHYLRQGKSQGKSATAAAATTSTETESKPDWLIKQEQKEREQAAASQSNNEEENTAGNSGSSNTSSNNNNNNNNSNWTSAPYGANYGDSYSGTPAANQNVSVPANTPANTQVSVSVGGKNATYTMRSGVYHGKIKFDEPAAISGSLNLGSDSLGVSNLDWANTANGTKWVDPPSPSDCQSLEKTSNGTYVYTKDNGEVYYTTSDPPTSGNWVFTDMNDPSKSISLV